MGVANNVPFQERVLCGIEQATVESSDPKRRTAAIDNLEEVAKLGPEVGTGRKPGDNRSDRGSSAPGLLQKERSMRTLRQQHIQIVIGKELLVVVRPSSR